MTFPLLKISRRHVSRWLSPAFIVLLGGLASCVALAQSLDAPILFPKGPSRSSAGSSIGAGRRLIEVPEPLREATPAPTRSPVIKQPAPASLEPETIISCVAPEASAHPLTALLPTAIGYEISTTILANPAVFIYLPETTAREVEFIMMDSQDQTVYHTSYDITGAPGILKLSFPPSVALEVGEVYKWEFALRCQPGNPRYDKYVAGKIQRQALSPELEQKLKQTQDPAAKARLYSQAGIWHEALSTLAEAASTHSADWQTLLTSADLQRLADAPFLNCCDGNQE